MPKKSGEKNKEKSEKISQTEYEKKVLELSKKGLTAEKIGEELRKQKIHPKEYSRKISQILKEKNLYTSPELKNIETKLKRVGEHCKKNKRDKKAMREKERVFAHLRKTKKYLKVPLK